MKRRREPTLEHLRKNGANAALAVFRTVALGGQTWQEFTCYRPVKMSFRTNGDIKVIDPIPALAADAVYSRSRSGPDTRSP